MKYKEVEDLLRKSNWTLNVRPYDGIEFKPWDYWTLSKERKLGEWEIETKNSEDNSTTLHLSSLRRAE